MNFRFVFNQVGLLLIVLSVCMIGSDVAAWLMLLGNDALGAGDPQARWALMFAALAGILIGGFLWLVTRTRSAVLGRREAMLLVAMSWLFGAAVSALPYWFWTSFSSHEPADHPFHNFVDCYFEAMSGLTTTGATVLSQIETMPPSLLLWRSLTHWLGGLGIVVLFVAVLPTLGVGGKKLFRVEAPGPEPEGVRPHIRETARVLWIIYLTLTVAQVVALKFIGSMSLFDSVCHTFATLATGGFSTLNASVGGYNSAAVDIIIIIFMVLAGVNFSLYFAMLRRHVRGIHRDPEFRCYLALLVIGSAIVVAALMGAREPIVLTDGTAIPPTFRNALRQGVFTTVSCQTTTGFCTADFNTWPFLAKAALITLMFIGGSAGSTAGGTKVIRVWIAFKSMLAELERVFRPQVVRPLKIGSTAVDPEVKLQTLAYIFGIAIIFIVGAVLIMVVEQTCAGNASIDFQTASTASIATLFNIGPGLGKVGAVENYGWFCDWSKLVMCLLMALGRLEVFAILVLFVPRFWRGD